MQTDELLLIARETIDKVPLCFAIYGGQRRRPRPRR
jgi:hypothetical protein